MRSFDRSDLGFAILLAPFLALAVLIFGSAVARGDFLAKFLPLLALIMITSFIRGPISGWGRLLRFVVWFCSGVAVGAVWSAINDIGYGLAHGAWLGLGFATGDFVSDFVGRKKEKASG